MANFITIVDHTINLDHVCCAKWQDNAVLVCLSNGDVVTLTGCCAEEFAVASGRKVETFAGPVEVESKPQNGLKELSSVQKAK